MEKMTKKLYQALDLVTELCDELRELMYEDDTDSDLFERIEEYNEDAEHIADLILDLTTKIEEGEEA
jgi:hypothetical protein